ncbi:hypothetical protein LV779_39150 [Streptomyces thinghirensis]|nr:hypothetical protein [Streptomyces thinghirensis]
MVSQLVQTVAQRLDVTVDPSALLEHPTVDGFAAYLGEEHRTELLAEFGGTAPEAQTGVEVPPVTATPAPVWAFDAPSTPPATSPQQAPRLPRPPPPSREPTPWPWSACPAASPTPTPPTPTGSCCGPAAARCGPSRTPASAAPSATTPGCCRRCCGSRPSGSCCPRRTSRRWTHRRCSSWRRSTEPCTTPVTTRRTSRAAGSACTSAAGPPTPPTRHPWSWPRTRSWSPARTTSRPTSPQFFDFRGPSLVVDTACSSALVAMDMAVQALRAGTVESAVVAGVSLLADDRAHRGVRAARAAQPRPGVPRVRRPGGRPGAR